MAMSQATSRALIAPPATSTLSPRKASGSSWSKVWITPPGPLKPSRPGTSGTAGALKRPLATTTRANTCSSAAPPSRQPSRHPSGARSRRSTLVPVRSRRCRSNMAA